MKSDFEKKKKEDPLCPPKQKGRKWRSYLKQTATDLHNGIIEGKKKKSFDSQEEKEKRERGTVVSWALGCE